MCHQFVMFFFFNDTATTEIYTLSLHDALPICARLRYALSAAPRSEPTSSPANLMLPPDVRTRRRMARPMVDLPEPLSPTRPRPNGPTATSSDTPSTARTGPNRTVRFEI